MVTTALNLFKNHFVDLVSIDDSNNDEQNYAPPTMFERDKKLTRTALDWSELVKVAILGN